MASVAVLGGGISGLSAAYYLARFAPRNTQIVLIEGSERLGGWIRSHRVGPGFYPTAASLLPNHDDRAILFEAGPRTLRPSGSSGAVTLDMIQDLRLVDTLLTVPKTHPSAKNRYIYYDGSINALPSSLSEMLLRKPPILKSVIPAILQEPFIRSGYTGDDESLYSLVSRRFNDHIALNLVGAMVHGIYAGDVKALSAQSTLRMIYENERVHGSVVKGLLKGGVNLESFRERGIAARARKNDPDWFGEMETMSVIGFKDGAETLTHGLRKRLETKRNVKIILGEPALTIKVNDDRSGCKITTSKQDIHVDHVISSIPSARLDGILHDKPLPHLCHNPNADVAVVNLAYTPDVKLKYDGFGFLTPYPEKPLPVPGVLGVVFDSNAMQGQDMDERVKLTVMIGGHQWNSVFGGAPIDKVDPKDAYSVALAAMKAYLGIEATPEYAMVHMQAKCIPQYLVGHQQRLRDIHHSLQQSYGHSLSVTGASYLSVSVPDCIKHSRELVEELLVAGGLGSKDRVVTGLNRLENKDKFMDESARLSKSHVNILMKS
ncbi:protoporphyrinogen oxidase [Dichotomocladium elegans]|nr:protoporphyrinogen oxidase [Dichotomocladium elegans]